MTHSPTKREMRLDLSTVIGTLGDDRGVYAHTPGTHREMLDLAFVRRIYSQFWPQGYRNSWNLHEWKDHLQHSQATCYLTDCGFVEFHPDEGQSLFVELLAVNRRHHRRGHGRALMSQVIRHGLALKLRRIILLTTVEVEAFYSRLGFEFYREVPDDDTPPPAAA